MQRTWLMLDIAYNHTKFDDTIALAIPEKG